MTAFTWHRPTSLGEASDRVDWEKRYVTADRVTDFNGPRSREPIAAGRPPALSDGTGVV